MKLRSHWPALTGALLLAASAAYAGGFYLEVSTPDSKDPRMKDAVAVFKADGCHGPGAKIVGTAEGIVNGKRRSIPLKLKYLGDQTFTVTHQWPKEGRWVLAMTAIAPPRTFNGGTFTAKAYAAVPVTASGPVVASDPKARGERPRIAVRRPTSENLMQLVNEMLKEPAGRQAAL